MKNISQAELEALLETAGEDGVTLEDLDLRGLDLSGQCLPGLAVIRCCAEHVNFRGTHFEGIGATDSNFYGADFTGCHFEDAQFSRCNLRASFWSDVTADALTFDGCDLTDATTPEGTVLNASANQDPANTNHDTLPSETEGPHL